MYKLHYRKLRKDGIVDVAEKHIKESNLLKYVLGFLGQNRWSILRIFDKDGKAGGITWKNYRIDYLDSKKMDSVNMLFIGAVASSSLKFKRFHGMECREHRVKL
jgi:hypothetical protein